MALINDELIKRYQRWFKENNGTTLDKYTARAHLKQMMGQGGKPSSTSGGMRTMAGGQVNTPEPRMLNRLSCGLLNIEPRWRITTRIKAWTIRTCLRTQI